MSEDETKVTTDLARRGDAVDPALAAERGHPENPLARIDARVADPRTPIPEAITLVQIRGEMIKQDELRLDRADLRKARGREFWGKLCFSIGGVATGVGLIVAGLHLEGFVILGAGFHWLAPDFVKSIYGRIFGGGGKDDEE